jgi:hypothetical protein
MLSFMPLVALLRLLLKLCVHQWWMACCCRDFHPEEELEKRRQSLLPILEAGVAEASAPRAEVCFPAADVACMRQVASQPLRLYAQDDVLAVIPDLRALVRSHKSSLKPSAALHFHRRGWRRASWRQLQGGRALHRCCWRRTRHASSVRSSSCSSRRILVGR